LDDRPRELTDEELALQAQAGCRRSFEELLGRYAGRLSAFLRPRLVSGQDVEDTIQETFLRLFRSLSRYDPRWKFSTWVYTIAGRLAIGLYRSQSKSRIIEEAAKASHERADLPPPPPSRPNLWEAAQRLPPKQYQALWLFYTEDMTVKEVAVVMEKTSLAVRMLLHHGRHNLSGLLGRAGIPSEAVGPGAANSPVRLKENLG